MNNNLQDVLDLRLRLLRSGYTPLPLYSKVPPTYGTNNKRKGFKNWQSINGLSPEQVETWGRIWPDAVNTGVLTHDVPAFDADLLNPEAAEAIEDMVREKFEERGHVMTRIGRPPKRAHLFRTDQPFKKITVSFEGEEKLEFLCDGQQVVVNGVHPDTLRPYAWFGGEPGPVAREDLPAITEAEAHELMECAAELLVREFGYVRAASRPNREKTNGKTHVGGSAVWQYLIENIRAGQDLHDSLCSLAAKLVKSGMNAGAAVNFLRATMEGSSAARDFRWYQRFNDIPRLVDGAEKFRDGGNKEEPEEPNDTEPEEPAKQAAAVLDGIKLGENVDWTKPEGLLWTIADWVMLTSRRPNRPMAVASAIAILSAVCGRHLYGPTGTALNVFLTCLARTSIGKDRPLAAPGVILGEANLARLHTTAKAFSVSAFEQMMIDHPCCLATVDEIGANLLARMSNKHASTHEQGMRSVLLELWSRDQFKGAFNTTRHAVQKGGPKVPGSVSIPRPNLTLFGVSTTEVFYASVTGGSVKDGFLNRFLTCEAAPRGKAQEVSEADGKVPEEIVEAIKKLVPVLNPLGIMVAGGGDVFSLDAPLDGVIRRLPWDNDDVRKCAEELEEQILVAMDGDPETAPLLGRVFEYSVRLASLHAVSRDGLEARVTMADLCWGAAFVVQSARAMVESVAGLMASTEYEAKFNQIWNVIKDAGQIARRELLRRIRSIKASERDAVITHLTDAGWIEEVQIQTKGRTAIGWRWR